MKESYYAIYLKNGKKFKASYVMTPEEITARMNLSKFMRFWNDGLIIATDEISYIEEEEEEVIEDGQQD